MTTIANALISWLAAVVMIVSLAACDTRPIPGDLILSTYNSDMEATKSFAPMDTLYVKVSGMTANSFYQISALDADGELISMIEARTDADGVIDPMALWYDVGIKGNAGGQLVLDTFGTLSPVGFKVNVKSLYDNGESTDFTQDLFFVMSEDIGDNPKPVVYACYTPDAGANHYPENAFKETGTRDADGNVDPKTVVYVKADRVPTQIGTTAVTAVDFYVMRFTGNAFQDGDELYNSDLKVVELTGQAVVDGAVSAKLLWDLNDADPAKQVINPTEDTMAYSIVMDVDRDGVYDAGIDTNSDGVSDYFIDGVDGNGVPGFIIQNTPANDMFVTISNDDGDIVNSIPETGATIGQYLNISIDNLPVATGANVRIYLVDNSFDPDDGDAIAADVRLTFDTVAASDPDTSSDDLVFLPYIKDRNLLDTSDSGNYDYGPAGTLTEDVYLDMVVDMGTLGLYDEGVDYLIENAVVVLDVVSGDYKTCSDTNGTPASFFDETNSDGNTVVYINALNATGEYDAYVMSDDEGNALADGDSLARVSLFYEVGLTAGTSTAVTSELWDLNGIHKVINPSIENNTYNIVIDEGRDGEYDFGTDTILTVVILNTSANAYPRVSYVNIASGGSFGNIYEQHWTVYSEYCDYRDVFSQYGLDTNPNGGGYGVKAVFNPYFSWWANPDPKEPEDGLYYGAYVDVYIVDATTFDLSDYGNPGELNDAVDVTGRHSTLCVQPSCYNGAGMMTIWPAQMTPGSYYVIVDVNQDGIINEGTDIIDAVNQDGETIIDDASIVGFSVE